MLGYAAVTAFVPRLQNDAFQRSWIAYWKRGFWYRMTPLGMVSILAISGSLPVRAQSTTFDPMAFAQHAAEYVKDAWRFAYQNTEGTQNALRQAVMAYRAYKQTRALYQRITGGDITLSLVQALPVLEVDTMLGQNSKEILTVRPVFRKQDKLNKPRIPKIKIPELDEWAQGIRNGTLDFDVDRAVVQVQDPNNPKTIADQAQAAIEDGWMVWERVQKRVGVAADILGIPGNSGSDPYAQLRQNMDQYYQKRLVSLREMTRNILLAYGEDSIQYTNALMILDSFQRAAARGDNKATTESIATQLETIDADARVQVEQYALSQLAMRQISTRTQETDERMSNIAGKYDSTASKNPVPALGNFMGLTGGPKDSEVPRESMGNQMKIVEMSRRTADHVSELLKLEARTALQQGIQMSQNLANQKAGIVNKVQVGSAVDLASLNAKNGFFTLGQKLNGQQLLLSWSFYPTSGTLVVPPGLHQYIGGSVANNTTAGENALSNDLSNTVGTSASDTAKGAKKDLQAQAKSLDWGIVTPFFDAITKVWNSMGNKPFNFKGDIQNG